MFRSIEMFATAWLVEPTYKVIHDSLLRGDGLLWNPYLAMGSPLWANIVMQVVNPLAWIAGFPEPSPETVLRYIFTYMLCAGFLTFVFLRQFLPPLFSSFGALAYMLNGYFMLYIGMSELSSCALIPGLFYAVEKLFREPGVKSVALLSLFTAAMVTICGIPELSLLAVCGAGLYFLFRLFTAGSDSESSQSSKESRVRIVSSYISANLLAGLYAAPLLLPFVEFLRESFNSHVRTGDFIPAGQEVFPFASANLITYLSPYFLSPILRYSTVQSPYQGYTGFWGITVFSLAVLATVHAVITLLNKSTVVTNQNFRVKQLLSVFCASSVVLLLAKKFGCPALQWFGALPLFSMILYWKYTEPIVAFLIATLAAIGLTWLSDSTLKLKTIRVVGLSVFVVYILLALTSIPLQRQEAQFYCYLIMAISIVVMGLFFSLASLAISQRRNAKQTCLFIFAMAAVELLLNFSGPSLFRDSTPKRDNNPYAGAPFITFLQQMDCNQRYERLFAQDLILIGNWASAFGLYDSRAYNALYPRRLMPFYRAFAYGNKPVSLAPGCWMPVGNFIPADLTEELYGYEPVVDPFINTERALQILRLWQLTSTRIIVRNVDHKSALPLEVSTKAGCEAPLVYGKEVNIFALSKILPRAALYYQVETAANESAVLAKLTNLEFDPFSKAVLERADLGDKELLSLSRFSVAQKDVEPQRITKYKGEIVDIEVQAKHPGLLVLNDIFYPGWQAFIDGQEAKIIHANYLFRGVLVPAGNHLVTFRYKPMSLLIGIGLAVLGVIILAGWWSISTIAERKRKTEKFD